MAANFNFLCLLSCRRRIVVGCVVQGALSFVAIAPESENVSTNKLYELDEGMP